MASTQKCLQESGSSLFPDNQAVYRALSDSQFVPFFQPLVTLSTGQLAGFEVLARWRHPSHGLIPPDKFIPLAERDGWIGELTRQILRKALRAAGELPGTFTICFNISPLQLRDLSLPEQISDIAEEAGFPLSRLIIEITESALIDDMEQAVMVVDQFKAMGCGLALDDFGTGYSSLRHLQSLPFDKLKVDRSFVSSMTNKRESRKIVSAVIGLGHSLGLTTVAEGIETQEQAEMMSWLGCELGQGYFFGRPMPMDDLPAALSAPRFAPLSDGKLPCKGITRSNLECSPSQQLAELQAIYDGAPVGLAFLDLNLRFVNLNKKLADINGGSVQSHLGRRVSETNPGVFPYVEPYLRRALAGEAISGLEVFNLETGTLRQVNYHPAIDEANEVVGIAVSVSEIADPRQPDIQHANEDDKALMTVQHPHGSWIISPDRQQPPMPTPAPMLVEDAPLKSYEAIALNLIAQSHSEKGIAFGELARKMHKIGLVQATSLAVNSLRRRKLIMRSTSPSPPGQSRATQARLELTPSGQRWLEQNSNKVREPAGMITPPKESHSLIDLLASLRFRH